MTHQVVVNLSDSVYRRAQRFAELMGQSLAEVIAMSVENTLPEAMDAEPVSVLSDEAVLSLAELQMQPDEDARHTELLYKQQAGLLDAHEQAELWQLTQLYRILLLRKSQAIREAVKRGLSIP